MGFTMLYDGFGSPEGDHVGLAHSTDGVRWEKYNDLTTDGVFEGSDPVFGPGSHGDFDTRSVQVGRLVATPADWVWSTWVSSRLWTIPGLVWLPAPT